MRGKRMSLSHAARLGLAGRRCCSLTSQSPSRWSVHSFQEGRRYATQHTHHIKHRVAHATAAAGISTDGRTGQPGHSLIPSSRSTPAPPSIQTRHLIFSSAFYFTLDSRCQQGGVRRVDCAEGGFGGMRTGMGCRDRATLFRPSANKPVTYRQAL